MRYLILNQYSFELLKMNTYSSKRLTRQGLTRARELDEEADKIYQEKNKRMKENVKEDRSQHEEKVRKEGGENDVGLVEIRKIVEEKENAAIDVQWR